ncbi:MAG TPA: VOC family protein [Actinomycetes bacterium]|nr:VOC family protein [Actinomycetes bacterium]
MATGVQVVIDCADPAKLAPFWADALGYVVQPPPPGFGSWPDWLRAQSVPEERWNDASAIVDPDRAGPRIFLQRVPEPKSVKNRVHLDLNVTAGVPGAEADEKLEAEAKRLEALGATRVRKLEQWSGRWIVMQDPEGNEFCVQ